MTSEQLQFLIIPFVLLPVFCLAIEKLWPQLRHYKTIRPEFRSDIVWYVFQTFVSHVGAPWIVFFAVLPVYIVSGLSLENYWSGFGPLANLPFAAQVVMIFITADFLSYWQHRMFHTKFAWPIHAVHHSSENLDWLASTRFHPLNEIGAQLIYVAPLIAVGFSPMAFVVLAPFTASYAVILHANVNWSFGSLRYVLASPTFHRWHHTSAKEGQDKNFAGFLPIWDVIFGTFYLPKSRCAEVFGIKETMPKGFVRQFSYPFNRPFKQRENDA